ncbi:MAG: hypothetical protein Q9219_004060 [cf. Caloplaca sp. 3 TL-2023]
MPQKRKQTPDMPQSPPKRVTRARAKKDDATKLDTTRIMTPSAKVSARKQNTAQAAKSVKSKVRELRDDDDAVDEAAKVEEHSKKEAPRTRGTAKATTETSVEPPVSSLTEPAKSTRSRSNKATLPTNDDAEAPKPKARSKKTARIDIPAAAETVEKPIEPEVPKKITRGRPVAAAANAPATRTRAAATAPKKRVKFDDQAEQDKENQPIPVAMQKKVEPKPTGLRAKPIRKPAPAKGGSRATKATKQKTEAEVQTPKQAALPLSPKKVTQVAKTPSVGSEDELAGDKTPLRILSVSPSKIPMSIGRSTDLTLSEPEVKGDDAPPSPQKATSPGRLAASPRKPPPSPFKDALKSSPRKLDLGSRPAPVQFDAPSSPSKSPLKESPKRVNLGESRAVPVLQWSKTPMKSSLLQSPARRPGGTSMKKPPVFFPSKAITAPSTTDRPTPSNKDVGMPRASVVTESASSSPLRAAKTTEQRPKVHDLGKERILEIPSRPLSSSPTKQHKNEDEHEPTLPFNASEELTELNNIHEQPDGAAVLESPQGKDPFDTNPSAVDPVHDTLDDLERTTADSLIKDPESGLQQAGTATCAVENMPASGVFPGSFNKRAFVLSSPMIVNKYEESESEDELASPQKMASPSPHKPFGIASKDFGIANINSTEHGYRLSTSSNRRASRKAGRDSIAMTPLAVQMSSWFASSPEKKSENQTRHKRGVFSPSKPIFPVGDRSPTKSALGSPAKPSFFDDEMAIRETEDAPPIHNQELTGELEDECDIIDLEASQESLESEIYGDENAAPEELTLLFDGHEEQNQTPTCTPARVFTQQHREIHTVSKVPLRPAADDTPLVVPRKRSRSLAGPLSDISMPDRLSISRDSILSPILQDRNLSMSMLPGDAIVTETPKTPTAGQVLDYSTPGRSIRKAGYSNVLKGAVVHVDVHTTEGADASGIFVDLLTQMGARCVKQWHWNPQGPLSSGSGDSPLRSVSPEGGAGGGKIGVTHVVYKDGGKRTLEKVREAKGAVLCVGVGWVLDCEREDKWLDEADYAIDTSIVPRGGSRRRKSMEPRALANLNGSLVPAETSPVKGPAAAEMSPTKEFLTFDTPASRRETFEFQRQTPPATPVVGQSTSPPGDDEEMGNEFDSPLSPTTPYYLSRGAKLVQQTCPPKQTQELFFPVSGQIEDQPNEAVRQRLLMARRKSLQWASKVQSPLGRTVSYGR